MASRPLKPYLWLVCHTIMSSETGSGNAAVHPLARACGIEDRYSPVKWTAFAYLPPTSWGYFLQKHVAVGRAFALTHP
jgi:hypothetical protein